MAWPTNSSNFPRPVAQFDQTACWAASLDWWLKCMQPARTPISQYDIINAFNAYWNHDEDSSEYGTVSAENLVRIVADDRFGLAYTVKSQFDVPFIRNKLTRGPVLLGYYEPDVSGFHAVVIHTAHPGSANGDVSIMDPNGGRFRSRGAWRFTQRNHLLCFL
jgi:hypothetical protein